MKASACTPPGPDIFMCRRSEMAVCAAVGALPGMPSTLLKSGFPLQFMAGANESRNPSDLTKEARPMGAGSERTNASQANSQVHHKAPRTWA